MEKNTKFYNFYVKNEGGDLQHINSIMAVSKKIAIQQMGSSLLIRMRKGGQLICITTKTLLKNTLVKDDFNGLVK